MFITKALAKSLLTFASRDTTRPSLNCIHFDGVNAIATDGHTLVRHVMTGSLVAGTVTRASFERACKVLPKDGAELTPELALAGLQLDAIPSSYKFPLYDAAIPAIASYAQFKTDATSNGVGACAEYLARLSLVAAACGSKGALIRAAGDTDPIRADCSGPLGTAVAVIMPMRI